MVSWALVVGSASGVEEVGRAGEPAGAGFQTGAEVLVERGWGTLRGLRVGLITNHTGRAGGRHLADLMHAAAEVELVALFGPEHGIRGDAPAGVAVRDSVDESTGVPVHSLYGAGPGIDPARLAGVEVLVFDIQDVGARFYTYISTMGYGMQAAAAAGIPFVVLDRPNPLGGERVAGPVLQEGMESFVGLYPIPVLHGMTVGELARMIQGERWLDGLESLRLEVVELSGWRRAMTWPDLGLEWPVPSPNLPDWHTALVYPGMCFIEGTMVSEGRGTARPFLQAGAPWADGEELARALNERRLPGVRFRATAFTPQDMPGRAMNPKFRGTAVSGVLIEVLDESAVEPVELGLEVVRAFLMQVSDAERQRFFNRDFFGKLAGNAELERQLREGVEVERIVEGWADGLRRFRERRQGFLLYR